MVAFSQIDAGRKHTPLYFMHSANMSTLPRFIQFPKVQVMIRNDPEIFAGVFFLPENSCLTDKRLFVTLFHQNALNFVGSSFEFYAEISKFGLSFRNDQSALSYIETYLLPIFNQCSSYSFIIEGDFNRNRIASGVPFLASLLNMETVQRCTHLKIALQNFRFEDLPLNEIYNWLLLKNNASYPNGGKNNERVLDIYAFRLKREIVQQLVEHLKSVRASIIGYFTIAMHRWIVHCLSKVH